MANKYCNLDGSKKIKDEYQKINIGFDKVEEDVNKINDDINALDERVDEIITTPVEDVSAEEIIDARGGRPVLGKRFEDIEDDLAAHKAEKVSDVGGVHGLIYEKGIWTPTLMFGGYPASDASFTSEGSYIRIGNKVHCNLSITITDPGTVEGSVQFGGLPFEIGSGFKAIVASTLNFALPTNVVWLFLSGSSGTRIQLYGNRSNTTPLAIANTDIVTGTRRFEAQFSYYI